MCVARMLQGRGLRQRAQLPRTRRCPSCVVRRAPQGKTLQVISLILAQPPAGTDYVAKARAVEANKRLKEQLDRGELELPTAAQQVGKLQQ